MIGRITRALRKGPDAAAAAATFALSGPLRVAIVGTGKAARFHARALAAIQGARLVCFINRGGTTGQALAEYAGRVPIVSGLETALAHGGFDVAIVAVSWESTADIAARLLRAGVPCLIEKPLGSSSNDADRIVEAGAGRQAYVAYNLRFQSSVLRACEIADALGRPGAVHIDAAEQSILAKMSSGTRTDAAARRWLLLNTTHALDLFQLLLGSPIDVTASMPLKYFDGVPCDYSALLRGPFGASGTFTSHWRSPGAWTMQVFGPEYRVSANLRSNSCETLAPGLIETREAAALDQEYKPGVVLQDYYFLQSILAGSAVHQNLSTLEQGLAVVALAESLMGDEEAVS